MSYEEGKHTVRARKVISLLRATNRHETLFFFLKKEELEENSIYRFKPNKSTPLKENSIGVSQSKILILGFSALSRNEK